MGLTCYLQQRQQRTGQSVAASSNGERSGQRKTLEWHTYCPFGHGRLTKWMLSSQRIQIGAQFQEQIVIGLMCHAISWCRRRQGSTAVCCGRHALVVLSVFVRNLMVGLRARRCVGVVVLVIQLLLQLPLFVAGLCGVLRCGWWEVGALFHGGNLQGGRRVCSVRVVRSARDKTPCRQLRRVGTIAR